MVLNIINVNINKEVCIISAYWHDVGRIKQKIENHKWNMKPKTTEGLLVKDADKLAWLGCGRWESCLKNKQKLDSLIELLPKLRQDILYFEESRTIYDRDIVNLVKLLYKYKH